MDSQNNNNNNNNFPLLFLINTILQSSNESVINNSSSTTNSSTTDTSISTETFLLGKGFTTTLDALLLVFALIMSILIPTLYFYNIILGRNRKQSDDEASKKNGQCGCYPYHWKNFICNFPMNSNNSLHLINDRGCFSLFQSTWFHIVIFRLACSCCGIENNKKGNNKKNLDASATNTDDTFNSFTHNDEVEDKKLQRKHIRLYNISCWISTVCILLLRFGLLAFAVVVAYYVGEQVLGSGHTWLTYTQYLTNNSFNVFVVYSFFVTVSHVGFLLMTSILACLADSDSLFPYLNVVPEWFIRIISLYGNALWILAELNLVTETVVSIGYWAIVVPNSTVSAARLVTFVNLTTHLFCWIASMIENLSSDFYFKFWHIFLVGIFCPCYLLFIILLRENGIISRMPYGSILDYYQGTMSIFFHFLFIFAYYVFFVFYWTVSTVIKKQLAVFFSDATIKKVASKSHFMRHAGQPFTTNTSTTTTANSTDSAFNKL